MIEAAGPVASAMSTPRTAGSKLFVDPPMAICWACDLDGVAGPMGFAADIAATRTFAEVQARIRAYHVHRRRRLRFHCHFELHGGSYRHEP